jgi:hypothetical protein
MGEFVDYVGESLRESKLGNEFPWSHTAGAFGRALEINLLDQLSLELDMSSAEVKSLFGVKSEQGLLRMLGLPKGSGAECSVALQSIRDLDIEPGVIELIVQCDQATRAAKRGRFGERRSRSLEAALGSRPEKQGYEAAGLIRRDLGISDEPLPNPIDLLSEYFDIEVYDRSDLRSTINYGVAGGHADGFGRVVLFSSPQTEKPWSRRMELFRCVGHLLLDAGPESWAIGAGSSNRAVGPRRRRSGAFAAEFLLPQAVIHKRCGGVLDVAAKPDVFPSLMADYGVGAQTAAWQCWNAGLLSSREVVYELIGAYGAEASSVTST